MSTSPSLGNLRVRLRPLPGRLHSAEPRQAPGAGLGRRFRPAQRCRRAAAAPAPEGHTLSRERRLDLRLVLHHLQDRMGGGREGGGRTGKGVLEVRAGGVECG